MKKLFVGVVLAVTLLAFGSFTQATMLTFNLNTEFSGATPPAGPTPWLTATFNDGGGTGSVALTMQATNLTGTEFISGWYFNLDPNYNPASLSISATNVSALTSWSATTGIDCCKADGDGNFDIRFNFLNNDFTAGESVSYLISLAGITASSFDFLSAGGGNSPNGLKTAAHVQSIGAAGDSGWITGGGGTPPETPPVPEPSTLLLLGGGLIGLVAFRKRFKR